MVEQEQKGVTNPSRMAANLPPGPFLPPRTFRIFSGDTYSRIRPARKVMTKNSGISSARILTKNFAAVSIDALIIDASAQKENRLVYEIEAFADCLARNDWGQAQQWLDESLLVMEVADTARHAAGIVFGVDEV